MKRGTRRLAKTAAMSVSLISVVVWSLAFAFHGLPPFWRFAAWLFVVFFRVGLLFGNLNALAMEPLGHIAGVEAAVVASVSRHTAAGLRISALFPSSPREWPSARHRGTSYVLRNLCP